MWLLSFFKVDSVVRTMTAALIIFTGIFVPPSFASEPAEVTVKNAWVKLAPPGTKVNAAYMQLYNHSSMDKAVVKVSADCCREVMVHQSRRVGDRIFMDHIDSLEVPARSELMLAPGGLHLMLIGAHTPLDVNDEVKITLIFSDEKTLVIAAPVIDNINE
jgi:copper(I)-binding protein